MTGKMGAKNANVDWRAVEKATEIRRTYEIHLINGGIIFKMYKPSEIRSIINDKNDVRNFKWKDVKMVGRVQR